MTAMATKTESVYLKKATFTKTAVFVIIITTPFKTLKLIIKSTPAKKRSCNK